VRWVGREGIQGLKSWEWEKYFREKGETIKK